MPTWRKLMVHPDHHVSCQYVLYLAPSTACPPGTRLEIRSDRSLVKLYRRGDLVKVHPHEGPNGRILNVDVASAETRDRPKPAEPGPRCGWVSVVVVLHEILDWERVGWHGMRRGPLRPPHEPEVATTGALTNAITQGGTARIAKRAAAPSFLCRGTVGTAWHQSRGNRGKDVEPMHPPKQCVRLFPARR